jgi:ubiquinone/menaquinone biosynthesis C-methylase UbiE
MSGDFTSKEMVTNQYRTAANLNARQRLHAEFSTNPRGWFAWYWDQLDLPAGSSILELGCGPAALWRANLARLDKDWQITLTDFSNGMVREARQSLGGSANRFNYAVCSAQAIPFPDASFDAVIANHMIYHLPDRQAGIGEMRRVLRQDGTLYAATNGENHMIQLDELIYRYAPNLAQHVVMVVPSFSASFTLENGAAQLAQEFKQVNTIRYPDSLRVTKAQPLVDYVLSMVRFTGSQIPEKWVEDLKSGIAREIQEKGHIAITKDPGLFIADRVG